MSRKFLLALFVLALPALLIIGMKVSGVIAIKPPIVKKLPPSAVELSSVPNVSIKRLDRVRSRGSSTSSSSASYEFTHSGTELKNSVQNVTRGIGLPVIGADNLPDGHYDIKVKSATGGQLGAAKLYALGLASAFPELDIKVDKLPATVHRLRCPDISKMASEFSVQSGSKNTSYSMSGGSTRRSMTISGPMNYIITQITYQLGDQKIIDETGLTEYYTMKLEWNPQDPDSLADELRLMGFEVALDTEVMDVLSITASKTPRPVVHDHEEAPAADPQDTADEPAPPEP